MGWTLLSEAVSRADVLDVRGGGGVSRQGSFLFIAPPHHPPVRKETDGCSEVQTAW